LWVCQREQDIKETVGDIDVVERERERESESERARAREVRERGVCV
jgi:hypothetical protein